MPRIMAQLEGEISDQPVMENGDAVFHVLGVKVVVRPSAARNGRVRTPTRQKSLTLAQLVDPAPLPGRAAAGFRGCTAIVVGNFDTDPDATGLPRNVLVVDYIEPGDPFPAPPPNPPFEYHPSLEVGPPESVLLGPVTRQLTAGARMTVNGVAVRVLGPAEDARLIPDEPANELGFPVDLSRVVLGTPVSIDGYPADNGEFVGFAIAVDDPSPAILADRVNPQVSITRAQASVEGGQVDYEVRGAIFLGSSPAAPPNQFIELLGTPADGSADTPIDEATTNAAPGGFDRWRIRVTRPLPLPASIFARYQNAPAGPVSTGLELLEVEEDPDAPPPP